MELYVLGHLEEKEEEEEEKGRRWWWRRTGKEEEKKREGGGKEEEGRRCRLLVTLLHPCVKLTGMTAHTQSLVLWYSTQI